VLSNLVSNAIRYTPAHGQVQVRCRVRQNSLWVQVCDNGLGIHPQERIQIFNEFYQVSAAKEDMAVGGLGLGLYIVKRIIQWLEHSLTVRSRFGRGSIFSVGIPLVSHLTPFLADDNDASTKTDVSKQLVQLLGGLLILVIEDDPRVLIDMEIFLKSFHGQVLTAASVQAAVDVVHHTLRTPDLIVSDY
jgi:two-component system, sensor histidine kinase